MDRFTMPDKYPCGVPLYWMYEVTGTLRSSVWRFINHVPNEQDIKIIRSYMRHWIYCPSWQDSPNGDVAKLRFDIDRAQTFEDLHIILHSMIRHGMDPF